MRSARLVTRARLDMDPSLGTLECVAARLARGTAPGRCRASWAIKRGRGRYARLQRRPVRGDYHRGVNKVALDAGSARPGQR